MDVYPPNYRVVMDVPQYVYTVYICDYIYMIIYIYIYDDMCVMPIYQYAIVWDLFLAHANMCAGKAAHLG